MFSALNPAAWCLELENSNKDEAQTPIQGPDACYGAKTVVEAHNACAGNPPFPFIINTAEFLPEGGLGVGRVGEDGCGLFVMSLSFILGEVIGGDGWG